MKKENIKAIEEFKLENIKKDVYNLLLNDNSGHDNKHIERVLNLALKFNKKEKANIEIITLITLLHDVDDYKLVGDIKSENLSNAKYLLNKYKIAKNIQTKVLKEISRIGYSKRLKGLKPLTLEGKIVSDADMCDAMGATGIIRSYEYSISKSIPFFQKDIFPNLNLDIKTYKEKNVSCINHYFEKLLKLKNLMLTEEGTREALKREKIMIKFLKNYFEENYADDWIQYLDNYLKKEN